MSRSGIGRAGLAIAAALGILSGVSARAGAAEQIVLPFECNVVGGRVQVRPSSDQAYRIYGPRVQDQYRACSEQSPDRCRTFLVHRFTMACGRDRAEWPDVYAAIAKVTDGRAFYNQDGRLYYRMGPREPRDSYPFPQARPATGIVEMPDGYAPMAGVDAIFTPLDPRVAELEDGASAEPRAYRDPPPASSEKPSFAPALTAKPDAKPKLSEAPAKTAAAAKAPEPPKPEVVLEPKPVPKTEPKTETKPLETASTSRPVPPAAEPATPPTSSPAAAAPVTPTILNNPAAREVENASKTGTVVAAAEIAPPPQAAAAGDAETRIEGWSATGGARLSVSPILFAVLIAAATLTVLLVILKKQAAAPAAAGPLRVPVEPVLPGLNPTAAAATGQALTVREDPAPPAVSAAAPAVTAMPVTREQALQLLGLSSGATEAAIRKVVEALRQSWHPDLAADETDRASREERIKAINVAAAILLRRSAA